MRFFVFILFLFPLYASAYTSVIATPENGSVVLPIENVHEAQELFGQLLDFPHTFQFNVTEETSFKAAIFVQDREIQKNDISIILVKAERRGVSEIGRTRIKDQSWASSYHTLLAESWRNGGLLEYTLVPGSYTFEVSSPNNEGKYRLVFGNERVKRGYFENLRVLFEVKSFLDSSPLSVVMSPLIYWPILIVTLMSAIIFYYKRKTKIT